MTSARDFCEASPRLLQRLLASASRCSRKTSTSSNFQRPGGHPAVTTSSVPIIFGIRKIYMQDSKRGFLTSATTSASVC